MVVEQVKNQGYRDPTLYLPAAQTHAGLGHQLVVSKTCVHPAPGNARLVGRLAWRLLGIKFIFESFVPLCREELLSMER